MGRYLALTSKDVKYEIGKEMELFQRLVLKLNKNLNEVIYIVKTNQEACTLLLRQSLVYSLNTIKNVCFFYS